MTSKARNKRFTQRKNRRVLNSSLDFTKAISGYRLNRWDFRDGISKTSVKSNEVLND